MEIASEMEIAIRTPMNTIIGYSEMLQEDNDKINLDNFFRDLEKIIQSGKQIKLELKSIINLKTIWKKALVKVL